MRNPVGFVRKAGLLVPILLALWACAAPPTGPARTREGASVIAVYQVAQLEALVLVDNVKFCCEAAMLPMPDR